MKFFRYFPIRDYTFQANSGTFAVGITDITSRVTIVERLKEHIAVMYDYVVADGERPDSIATRLYGSPDYTWIVLIVNNIMSHYDWPLTNEEFDAYIITKYGSVQAAQAEYVYKTVDGHLVDATTYGLMDAAERGLTTTAYDYEMLLNEDKRRIKVIPAEFAVPLVAELKRAFA